MAAPKRTDFERENDYRRITDLYLQGKFQSEIASVLGVSQQQVSYDLAAIQRRWRSDTTINLDEAKQKELARVDNLERVYWGAWERSLEEKVKTRTEKQTGKDGGKASVEKETLLGNPAYLAGVQWCISERCKLLGLYAPTKIAPTTPDGKESIPIAIFQPGLAKQLLGE
jgi:hypothetical protein